jgi:hypothetical protein
MVSVASNSQGLETTAGRNMASTDRPENAKPGRNLTPQARRALAEAEERRRLADARRAASPPPPKEVGGQDGPDPTRYGDWEKNGIASDF